MKNAVFVEYEYEERELPWRSELAISLRRYFDGVFIGYRDELMNYALTLRLPGVYFAKDLPPERLQKASRLKQLNIRFALLDEEAFSVFQLPEKLYYYRYAPSVLQFLDAICVGSHVELSIVAHNLGGLQEYPKILKGLSPRYHAEKFLAHPRISTVHSRKKLLFPMSMPVFHSAGRIERGKQIERMLISLRRIVPNEKLKEVEGQFLYRYTRMRRLNIRLLIYLNKVSVELGLDVVVRVHPTERFNDFYEWASRNFPLLQFNRPSTPIGSEIVEHDIVVHTNCTSGLESYNFYGRKTVCLNQIVSELPSTGSSFYGVYGLNVTSMTELVEAIRSSRRLVSGQKQLSVFFDRCSTQQIAEFLYSIATNLPDREEFNFKSSALFTRFTWKIFAMCSKIRKFFTEARTALQLDPRFEQVASGVYKLGRA
jgi:hypothetical protein